ncbi:MAG: hypothetical protein LBJ67_02985 [Planctomycetaceae bacterium]|jgi:hypothetical protein|nr:hypothetical protein [Planctomycetaceae bacterium]
MKVKVFLCGAILVVFGSIAWQDGSAKWFINVQTLTQEEEQSIIAGTAESGYYCATGTGGCTQVGASAGYNDAYDCKKENEGKDCNSTWCAATTDQECKQASWGVQWLYSCSPRTQGCPKKVAVCKKMTGGIYVCLGERTQSYSGCGEENRCD